MIKNLLFYATLIVPLLSFSQNGSFLYLYKWGYNDVQLDSVCAIALEKKYGFRYVHMGCVASKSELKTWKEHNSAVDKKLKDIIGDNWITQYEDDRLLSIMESIEANWYNNYRNLNDSVFSIGDRIKVPMLYFDFNKFKLTKESLDSAKVVSDFILKHPELKIELSFYSDTRAKKRYNKKVTSLKAKQACFDISMNYFLDVNSLDQKGYGESIPIYSDKLIDKVHNTVLAELYHRKNNRVEMKVVAINESSIYP